MSFTTRAHLILILLLPLHATAKDMPSYQAGVTAMKAARADKAPLSEDVMRVLKQSAATLSAALPAPGLQVGDTAPDFTLSGAHGQTFTLSEALKAGPVVVTFYRGAWCPYCNIALQALSQSLPEFSKHGAQVVAISPQTVDRSEAQASEKKLDFPLLSDLDNQVMKDYNVHFALDAAADKVYRDSFGIDVPAYNGAGRLDLPVPGTFIIGQDGTVKAAFADTDYKNRMEPVEIVKALKALK